MTKTLGLFLSLTATSLLVGCSSTPSMNPDAPQYCETTEQIDVVNGHTVSSKVRLDCSDSPAKRAKLVGVDPKTCRPWQKKVMFNGTTKELHGYLCKDENGNWRPLNQF